MATVAQAYVQIIPSTKGLSGSITKALGGESKSAGEQSGASLGASLVGKLKGVIGAAAIGKFLKDSIEQGAALEQSLGGIETLFKDSADKVKAYAAEAYKTTGLSANDYMENVTSFSASLLSSLGGDTAKAADSANQALTDMSDNANKMGTSMDSITYAYQGFAKQNYTMLDNLKLGYGGTKSEMERLLADAEKISGVHYDLSNLNDVYSAIHVIQGELGITGTTALEASTTISGSIGMVKAAAQDLMANLALGNNVMPQIQNLTNSIITAAQNVIPAVANVIAGAIPALLQIIVSIAPTILSAIGDIINQIAMYIGESGPDMMENIQNVLTDIYKFMLDSFPDIVDTVTQCLDWIAEDMENYLPLIITQIINAISTFISTIVEHAPQILQATLNIILAVANALLENIPVIVDRISDLILAVVDFIVQAIPMIIEAGVKLFVALIQNLPEIINTIVDALPQIITAIVTALTDAIPQIIQAGVTLFIALVKNLPAIISAIVRAIPQILSAIVKGFTNSGALNQLANAGKQLIAGIGQGFVRGVSAVISKAKQACSKIVSSVKGFFGIHSPSRVFAGIGEYLDMGLAAGITDNMDVVDSALANMTDSVSAGVNVNAAIDSSNAAIGAAGVSPYAAATNYGGVTINVYAKDGQSAREIAEQVSDILNSDIQRRQAAFA